MWIIDFVPVGIVHFLTFVSVIGTIITLLSGLLPMVPKHYKVLAQIGFVSLLVTCLYLEGGISEQTKWKAKVAEQEKYIAHLQTEAGKITIKEVIKYVDRVRVVKEKGDVIIKEVPIYITEKADDACIINTGFVELHDKAVRNEIPDTTGNSYDAASDVKLSTVAEVVISNYNLYHQQSEQLIALQSWIKEQEKLHNK